MAGASPQVTFDSKATVERFNVFLSSHGLPVTDIFSKLPRRRVIVIIGWFCHLERIAEIPDVWRPGARRGDKSNQGTDVLAQFAKKPTYVPAAEVYDGEKVHFVEEASKPFAPPIITPPRVCQLCGRGFLNNRALGKHHKTAHVSTAEVRKRTFWEAEQLDALALPATVKRNYLGNGDREFRCSRPGGDGELEQREDVACVVCACKDWSEHRSYVYIWQQYVPDGVEAAELPADPGSDDGADAVGGEAADDRPQKTGRASNLLRDEDGVFYFGEPATINSFLAVERYQEFMPNIPVTELHGSAVQHPDHPEFRWLTQLCER